MADAADKAQKRIDEAAELALDEIRANAGRLEAEATGYCLNCGHELDHGLRWCDARCRDEWAEERERADFNRDNQARL